LHGGDSIWIMIKTEGGENVLEALGGLLVDLGQDGGVASSWGGDHELAPQKI
jgi:hypothetical protein